jgi:hypothetical protein
MMSQVTRQRKTNLSIHYVVVSCYETTARHWTNERKRLSSFWPKVKLFCVWAIQETHHICFRLREKNKREPTIFWEPTSQEKNTPLEYRSFWRKFKNHRIFLVLVESRNIEIFETNQQSVWLSANQEP